MTAEEEEEQYEDGLARLSVQEYLTKELRRELKNLFATEMTENIQEQIKQRVIETFNKAQVSLKMQFMNSPLDVSVKPGGVVEVTFLHKL